MNQFPEKTGVSKAKTHSGMSGSAGPGSLYQPNVVGLGGTDGPSSYMGHGNTQGILQGSGKINSFTGGSTGTGSATQYRGYSPSKPKWKSPTVGMPQTNNLVGGSSHQSHHNQMISHVQGYSAASSGGMALRSKNKH